MSDSDDSSLDISFTLDSSEDEDPERDTSTFFAGTVKVSITVGRTTISVVEGDISNQQVDVILNSTSKKLDLNAGKASKALLTVAGNSLQTECKEKYPTGIQAGEVAITGGGNLKCQHVFHTSLLKWSDTNSKQVHKSFIENSLIEMDSRGLTSMAIPGLTTGYLRFPKRAAAKSKCIYIQDYLEHHTDTSITDIRFVIHSSDQRTLNAFVAEVKRWRSFINQSVHCRDVFSTQIGNTNVKVKIDKIQDQDVDVIVNSVNSQLKLDKGSLSHTLVSVGGNSLQTECTNKYPNGLQVGQVAVTSGGNLKCKQVYHSCIGDFKNQDKSESKKSIQEMVKTCLDTAHTNNMTSIAFPCLGTRYRHYPAKLSAQAMFDGIRDFTADNVSSSVSSVIIVVYGSNCEKIAKVFEAEGSSDATGGQSTVRGTKEFCSKMYQTELSPPKSWTHYSSVKSVKQWKSSKPEDGKYFKLIEIQPTDNVYQAIESLVHDTWESGKVGHGRDAAGLGSHKTLAVKKIERLENIDLWESYGHLRSQLFHKASDIDIFDPLENLPNSKGPIKTSENIQSVLENEIYPEVNEVYLFHGTKADKFDAVMSKGLDFRMAGDKAMFGSGTYMAESSTKADQYTDPRTKRSADEKKMILARVCLGKICLLQKAMGNLKKPPCSSCQQVACEHGSGHACDSVVGDGGWIFREFIVYNQFQAYPEYVITYIRQ
ncbi:blast:Poly [Mytilus galloprovincialis]|uniref:Poly [ADP-ribose] polymerase n=1 Tax=Mytilus galloprovincialis TaxID=29158 RepID=A0A8B6H2A2_MYTGA|nr:blast:Poly [Mytilus galloprovincialis]